MHRPRLQLPWTIALALVVVLTACSAAVAGFSTTGSDGMSIATDRVFSGQRTTAVWSMVDSADSSAADVSSSTSFAEGTTYTTGNWSSSFSATRYFEIAYAAPLPGGVPVSSVTFNFVFSANNSADTVCFYIEVYTESTGTLLGTHGSSGSSTCTTGTTLSSTTVSLTEITTSDQANDLRVRIYMKNSGNRAVLIDLGTVTGSSYSTFTLYNLLVRDRSTGTASTSAGGIVTSGDGTVLTTTNWNSSFAANRYFTLAFPEWIPSDATVTAADFQLKYRSNSNGQNACWYFEFYDAGNTLLATHGSSSSTISCNSSNSTYVTDSVTLSEVTTAARANAASVKIFFKVGGNNAVQFDNAQLRVTYSLGTGTGCASPGTQTVDAVTDTYVDQGSATSNFGSTTTASVQSRSGSRNRRMLLSFPLPVAPTGCSVTASTLRVNASAASGTVRTLEVRQVSSTWAEKVVTWNTKPTTTGTAATTSSATGWLSWTVTTMVQAMIGGSHYGFEIKDSAEDSATQYTQTFRTTEGLLNPAQLDITFG